MSSPTTSSNRWLTSNWCSTGSPTGPTYSVSVPSVVESNTSPPRVAGSIAPVATGQPANVVTTPSDTSIDGSIAPSDVGWVARNVCDLPDIEIELVRRSVGFHAGGLGAYQFGSIVVPRVPRRYHVARSCPPCLLPGRPRALDGDCLVVAGMVTQQCPRVPRVRGRVPAP